MTTQLADQSNYAQAEINLQLDAEEKIKLMRDMIRIRRFEEVYLKSQICARCHSYNPPELCVGRILD